MPDRGEYSARMSAYIVYQAEVIDPSRYDAYKTEASAAIAAAGGRYIVRGGATEALEGAPPQGRTVIVEFPTMQEAIDWYHGPAYSAARKLREGVAKVHTLFIVEGMA